MDIPATQALRVLRAAGIFSSPFGTRKALPVYAEATLFDLPALCINGGRRGLLVRLTPHHSPPRAPLSECHFTPDRR
ncbi:MAG: hypothetical protein GX571_05070 [Lentisphaerae bacterium]|jgi:hypothetical protein|nr:hypothetical protein [Lentisphaerota bacterium]